MLATEMTFSEAIFDNADLIVEEKLDGHRILIVVENEQLDIVNRNGVRSQHYQRLRQFPAMKLFATCDKLVVDAELVGDTLWAFDMPWCEDLVSPDRPWYVRRVALETLLQHAEGDSVRMVPCARNTPAKIALVERCLNSAAEGLMVKHLYGTYHEGRRTNDWRKIKFTRTVDCVVSAVGTQGKANATLSLWDGSGLVEIGRCSTLGKPAVAIGDILEVRYLYVGANGRLYQPVMLRIRPDKTIHECTLEQLQ